MGKIVARLQQEGTLWSVLSDPIPISTLWPALWLTCGSWKKNKREAPTSFPARKQASHYFRIYGDKMQLQSPAVLPVLEWMSPQRSWINNRICSLDVSSTPQSSLCRTEHSLHFLYVIYHLGRNWPVTHICQLTAVFVCKLGVHFCSTPKLMLQQAWEWDQFVMTSVPPVLPLH